MSKICFSQKPLKRFYSYVGDGHIYNITSVRPTVIAEGGGYWHCYFDIKPYVLMEDSKYYPLFVKRDESQEKPSAIMAGDYRLGTDTYWYYKEDAQNPTQITETIDVYYSSNGVQEYQFPNIVEELPHVKMDKCEEAKTPVVSKYYFDPLINKGDKYDKDNGQFVAMDILGSPVDTYGTLLNDAVYASISVRNFISDVNQIPEYLLPNFGTAPTAPYRESTFVGCGSPSYDVPDFQLYGELFMNKLIDAEKSTGDEIVSLYKNAEEIVDYKSIDITAPHVDASGTDGVVTNHPVAKS